ncbi:unnamed protein product, partial [Cuscuta epithymum]
MRVNCFCNLSEVGKRIKEKLNEEEITLFRSSVLGWILDIEHMPRLSGQLNICFVANYIEEFNGNVEKDVIRFHVANSLISFTKADLAIVTGLKINGVKPAVSDNVGGDMCRRYFGTKEVIVRQDIVQALERYNRNNPGTEENDGLKLGLLYALAHGLFGNQYAIRLPGKYINLVQDLDAFNSYPWGDDVWDDLVANMKNNAEALKFCTRKRVAFTACMQAIQIWAFETFPILANERLCYVIKDKENVIPRTLKWAFHKKPSIQKFCELIFSNDKFEWTKIVPSADEIQRIQGLVGGESNEAKDLRIDATIKNTKQSKKDARGKKGKEIQRANSGGNNKRKKA